MLTKIFTEIIFVGGIFLTAAILLHGMKTEWWHSVKTAETLTNVQFFFFDGIFLAPFLAVISFGTAEAVPEIVHLRQLTLPIALEFLCVVLLSDLVGYWRHRLLHISMLWPSHAVHHSDRAVQWLTLVRVHPVERFANMICETVALSLIGAPPELIAANNLLRHYYGYFLHADVQGRWGTLRYVLVTPHLHRWHHSDSMEARDKNFASIFSFLDLAFGTFYCPKHTPGSLGVSDMEGKNGFIQLLFYPFISWMKELRQSLSIAPTQARHRRDV